MFQWLRNLAPRQASVARPNTDVPAGSRGLFVARWPGRLGAKYDAAATNEDNRRHWANADHLSADAAASPDVRRILRSRSRYEVANNAFARGLVLTLANDVIGTGPRLQMLTDDPEANNLIEREFVRWARSIDLAGKLRTMRTAQGESGEVFAILQTNPRVRSSVKLDLRLIEADQVTTPRPAVANDRLVDGIVFDELGNVVEYHVLRRHPGDAGPWTPIAADYDAMPAEQVVHLFRADRPGQHRGIPELTPALPLFALLRRYRLAVLTAAETAASFALPIYTDMPPNGEADALEPMDLFEYERGLGMVLPQGWKPAQIKAEHPSTNHVEFIQSVWAEIVRCVVMPYIIASGDSSKSNYASGRLDRQTYHKAVRIDQEHIGLVVMDRILQAWLDEAVLIEGYLPQSLRTADVLERFDHQWFWDGFEHVDPAKEANAQATRLANHTTTLAAEWARQGLDYEIQLRQRAREMALLRELGISEAQAVPDQPASDADEDEAETADMEVEQ